MECQNALLIDGLDWNEAHVGSADGFADRLCVGGLTECPRRESSRAQW
jgi:hypothetical protein